MTQVEPGQGRSAAWWLAAAASVGAAAVLWFQPIVAADARAAGDTPSVASGRSAAGDDATAGPVTAPPGWEPGLNRVGGTWTGTLRSTVGRGPRDVLLTLTSYRGGALLDRTSGRQVRLGVAEVLSDTEVRLTGPMPDGPGSETVQVRLRDGATLEVRETLSSAVWEGVLTR